MILYRFITDWWIENATSEGIEDILIDDLDNESMTRLIQEFRATTDGHNFKEFKKYLICNGVRIIDVPQVDIFFSEKD